MSLNIKTMEEFLKDLDALPYRCWEDEMVDLWQKWKKRVRDATRQEEHDEASD